MKTFGDVFPDVVFAGSSVRIVPIEDLFVPFLVLNFDLVADFLLNDVGKVGGSAELLDVELEHLCKHFDAQRSVSRVIATFIDVAFDNRWSHPVVCNDEVYPAFFGSVIRVAGWESRFALASQTVISDVCPPFLIDEGHRNREKSMLPFRSPMMIFGPGSMLSN